MRWSKPNCSAEPAPGVGPTPSRLPLPALTVQLDGAAALGTQLSQVKYTVLDWPLTVVVTAVSAWSALYR